MALASLLEACTPQPSRAKPPTPPAPSPAPTLRPEETFALSNVRLQATESDIGVRVQVASTVKNRLTKHAGGTLCLDLIDKDGYFVTYRRSLDGVGLRAGDSDTLEEASTYVDPQLWEATTVLHLSMDRACSALGTRDDLRSAVLSMDTSGRVLPPEAWVEGKRSAAEAEDIPDAWFELKDARLVQNELGEVMVSYTLTNRTQGRASGQLCARLTNATRCSCQGLDEAQGAEISLGLGVSTRKTSRLDLKDNAHWGQGQQVQLYMGAFGCSTLPVHANSNVITLTKPRSIEAPPPTPEPEGNDD